MPRRRPRFDERKLFAILLLEFGILLPLASAFSAPPATLPQNVVSLPELSAPADGLLPALGPPEPVAAAQQPAAPEQPTPSPPLPTPDATLLALQVTPTQLPPVSAAAEAPGVPTLMPTQEPQSQPLPTLVPTQPPQSQPPTPNLLPAPDAPAGGPPPILMYHYIRSVDASVDPLGYELSVTPEMFDAHMAWLHEQGYVTMRMDAAARCIRGEGFCPAKAVALTFDDGYEDAFTSALPTLQRYGFTATFYIISGFVGQPGYMTWEQIGALRDAGMEIGAHTIDHYDLTTLDPAEADRQIVQSKVDIEQRLGIGVQSFCYPTGLYNWSIEEQARAANYLSATTTRWDGDYSDMMALPRRRISGGVGVDGFAATVLGY